MLSAPLRNRSFFQNSWVVDDIQAAMAHWVRTTGVGPFLLVEGLKVEDQLYRGRPVDVDFTVAIAQAGDVQVELVQQNNDAPSAYRDLVPAGRSGFHHVALYCHDYDADLGAYLAEGFEVAFSGAFAGKRYCYVDTSPAIGCMVELIEHSEAQAEFFARIRAAAAGWDGRDPVRPAF